MDAKIGAKCVQGSTEVRRGYWASWNWRLLATCFRGRELNLGPLSEQYALLTTESSLRSLFCLVDVGGYVALVLVSSFL